LKDRTEDSTVRLK